MFAITSFGGRRVRKEKEQSEEVEEPKEKETKNETIDEFILVATVCLAG